MTLTLPASYTLALAARILKLSREPVEKRAGDTTLKIAATLYAGDYWAQGGGWSGSLPRNAADGQLTGLITGRSSAPSCPATSCATS